MMSIFIIIAGVLATWFAIFGKAPGFKNDYPKEMKEDADRLLRNFCWALGPIAIASGILEMIPGLEWTYWVGLAIILPLVIAYIIVFRIKFKKYLKKMK
jgi:hypothetical protein